MDLTKLTTFSGEVLGSAATPERPAAAARQSERREPAPAHDIPPNRHTLTQIINYIL